MPWFDRIKIYFKREAHDVKDGLAEAGRALDEVLAKKERELAATPEERIDMILEEQQADDARFEKLADRVRGRVAEVETGEEVGDTADSNPGPPPA